MQTSQPVLANPVVPPPAPSVAEFTVGGLISRTFSVWWKNVWKLSLLTLLAWVPAGVMFAVFFSSAFEPRAGAPATNPGAVAAVPFLAILVTLPLFLAQLGAVTYGAVQHLAGNPVRLGAMIRAGFRRIWPLVLVGILSGLIVLGGMLLLVIPGIIFAFALSVAVPAVVAERIGPVEAIRRSFALTKGSRLLIFASGLVVGLVGAAANGVSNGLVALVGRSGGAVYVLAVAVGIAIEIVFATLPTVLPAVAYHDLRLAKEGVDTAALAKVFE